MADAATGRTAVSPAPAAAMTLDAWTALGWADGLQIASLRTLDVLHIRTRNTLYEITVLDPAAAEVMVRGGRFFPAHQRAVLSGSSLGGAFLKLHGVYVNFCMELNAGMRVVTTAVQSIAVTTHTGRVQ